MTTVTTIAGAAITAVLIAAVTVLTWHGSISGEAAMTLFAALTGVGTTAGVAHVAVKTGASAALSTPSNPSPPAP